MGKKKKTWPVFVWFLDKDLASSASYLTNEALNRSINGCIGALVSAYFYFVGIRTKKIYEHFFSKENAQSTLDEHFLGWPLKKLPSFASYSRKESKWCRSCNENFQYIKTYLNALLDEFCYRSGHEHRDAKLAKWFDFSSTTIDIPNASIQEVVLPWKVLEPRFRRIDIIEGYRLQFMSLFENDDPFGAYSNCKRDIPEFVVEHYRLNNT